MSTQLHRFGDYRDFYQEGLKVVYHDTLKKIPQQYKMWLKEEAADDYIWTTKGHSGLGVAPMVEQGAAFASDKIFTSASKTYQLVRYGLSIELQSAILKYDKYKVFSPLMKELAKTSVVRYDLQAYGIFNQSFVTTDPVYTNYNNEALCSSTHARMDGGTWKNRPTSAQGLSMAALETASNDLQLTVNDRGQYLLMAPRKLVTGVSLSWLVGTLLKSDYNPENANEAYNNAKAMSLSHHASPYIESVTAWWVLCDTKSEDFQIKMRKGESPDLASSEIPANRNLLYTSMFTFAIEVWQSRGMYGDAGV